MSSNPTKSFQAYQAVGTAIALPFQRQFSPFTPNAIHVTNRSSATLQVGPTQQGPFLLVGQYTDIILPWKYGPSLYVSQNGTTTILSTDFIEISFLSVDPTALGAGSVVGLSPSVGASNKTLLNTVPSTGSFPSATYAVTGIATMYVIPGCPASAVEATISVRSISTRNLSIASDTSPATNVCAILPQNTPIAMQVRVPISVPQQVNLFFTGAGTDNVSLVLVDYNEPF